MTMRSRSFAKNNSWPSFKAAFIGSQYDRERPRAPLSSNSLARLVPPYIVQQVGVLVSLKLFYSLATLGPQ
jgi:hypothetical protein